MGLIRPDSRRPLNRVSDRPSAFDSPVHPSRVSSEPVAEFSDRSPDPLVLLNPVRSGVSRLRLHGRPSTVGWLVVPVDVDAVDLVALRSGPHVRKEVLKGVHPPSADRDSAPPVVRKSRVVRIDAPRLHTHPNAVLGSTPHPVPSIAGSALLRPKASARGGTTSLQARSGHHLSASAVALDEPRRRLAAVQRLGVLKHHNTPESTSNHRVNIATRTGVCNPEWAKFSAPEHDEG